MGADANQNRPMSPFTTVWRWHVTMVTSILHRLSGIVLGGGSVLITLWVWALAAGEKRYEQVMGLLGSWPGKIVLFAFSLALFFHLLNGVRHLVWDSGRGYDKESANQSAWLVMALSLVLTLILWSAGYWVFEAFPGQKSL